MKLEINQTIVAEDADADDIKDAMKNLNREAEAMIMLSDREGIFLQAAGVPVDGFVMGYQNSETGEELTSKNQALKQQAVTRALTAYVNGSWDWRSVVGWEPSGAFAAKGGDWKLAMRRAWPLYVGMLFFAVAIVPLVMATKYVVDQTVFKGLCEQYAPDFDHFQHGSGNGNINVGYSPGRCWYKEGVNVELQDIVGSGAVFIDTAGSIAQVVVPIILIVVIEVVGFVWWRGRRKAIN